MNKPTVYLQDADGNERTLNVTEPDPEDGTFCAHMDDEGQSWIRIVPDDPTEEKYFTRVPIVTWDNRDPGETWLWYDEIHYISVSPFEMIENMIENCKPWIVEEVGVSEDELEKAMQVLARACGQT